MYNVGIAFVSILLRFAENIGVALWAILFRFIPEGRPLPF